MVRCPACTRIQLVYVQGLARTSCYCCRARSVQSGEVQNGIIGRESLARPKR